MQAGNSGGMGEWDEGRLNPFEHRCKVLRQARLPKWRGLFQWQIETLQAAYARLSVEVANGGG